MQPISLSVYKDGALRVNICKFIKCKEMNTLETQTTFILIRLLWVQLSCVNSNKMYPVKGISANVWYDCLKIS